jgi:hypothetical protein
MQTFDASVENVLYEMGNLREGFTSHFVLFSTWFGQNALRPMHAPVVCTEL